MPPGASCEIVPGKTLGFLLLWYAHEYIYIYIYTQVLVILFEYHQFIYFTNFIQKVKLVYYMNSLHTD